MDQLAEEEWAEAQRSFEHATAELRRYGVQPALVRALLRHGQTMLPAGLAVSGTSRRDQP